MFFTLQTASHRKRAKTAQNAVAHPQNAVRDGKLPSLDPNLPSATHLFVVRDHLKVVRDQLIEAPNHLKVVADLGVEVTNLGFLVANLDEGVSNLDKQVRHLDADPFNLDVGAADLDVGAQNLGLLPKSVQADLRRRQIPTADPGANRALGGILLIDTPDPACHVFGIPSMHKIFLALLLVVGSVAAQTATSKPVDIAAQKQQVHATEAAFAATMAARDFEKFCTFIADDAVFFSATPPVRGKEAVALNWKPHFIEKEPPFSWAPETVEVLPSGNLAFSTGPVFDKTGKQFATFTSIWRLEKDGAWRIVFDNGNPIAK